MIMSNNNKINSVKKRIKIKNIVKTIQWQKISAKKEKKKKYCQKRKKSVQKINK